jgi:hypothetical protein
MIGAITTGLFGTGVSTPTPAPSYDSIATATGTGSSAVISFTSIPSTYKHLQFRVSGLSTGAADWVYLNVNNDSSTSNYWTHRLEGDGTSVATANTGSQAYMYRVFIIGSTTSPGAAIIDVLDYANTNKNKTFKSLAGFDVNAGGEINIGSGLWTSTSAINRIDFNLASSNYATATKIALYGIKG